MCRARRPTSLPTFVPVPSALSSRPLTFCRCFPRRRTSSIRCCSFPNSARTSATRAWHAISRWWAFPNMPTIAPTNSRAASASVAIARALATHSRIVLADEPTANLDRKTGEEILRLMKKINRRYHTTFIFSTHDRRVMNMADRLVRIEDGRITQLGVRAKTVGYSCRIRHVARSSRGINMVLWVAPCRCIGTRAACDGPNRN